MTYRKQLYRYILLPNKKSKVATAAILKFTLAAITRSLLQIFAQGLRAYMYFFILAIFISVHILHIHH